MHIMTITKLSNNVPIQFQTRKLFRFCKFWSFGEIPDLDKLKNFFLVWNYMDQLLSDYNFVIVAIKTFLREEL